VTYVALKFGIFVTYIVKNIAAIRLMVLLLKTFCFTRHFITYFSCKLL